MAKTNKDYKTTFLVFGEITVPKGTRVSSMTAQGIDLNYNFVDEYAWVYHQYPGLANTMVFELRHRGLDIPKEFVTD